MGFTYSVHSARAYFSCTAFPSPRPSRTVIGFPVIRMVSWPLIRTCPVTAAAPQSSVALMNEDQCAVGTGGPPMPIAACPHALAGVLYTGDRLYLWSK